RGPDGPQGSRRAGGTGSSPCLRRHDGCWCVGDGGKQSADERKRSRRNSFTGRNDSCENVARPCGITPGLPSLTPCTGAVTAAAKTPQASAVREELLAARETDLNREEVKRGASPGGQVGGGGRILAL